MHELAWNLSIDFSVFSATAKLSALLQWYIQCMPFIYIVNFYLSGKPLC